MHNHNDTYPVRPGFESGTPRLQAPVDKNESFYLELRELEVLGTWNLDISGTSELTLACPRHNGFLARLTVK